MKPGIPVEEYKFVEDKFLISTNVENAKIIEKRLILKEEMVFHRQNLKKNVCDEIDSENGRNVLDL